MTECSPESITGALTATLEAVGVDTMEAKLSMSKAQKQGYTAKIDDLFDDAFHDGSRLREGDDKIIDWIAGSRDNFDKPATSAGRVINGTKSLFYQFRNVSQSLGEDVVQPFQQIMEKVNGEYKDNPDGRKIYNGLIKDKIKELEASRPELADSPAWSRYSNWLKDGGSLYHVEHQNVLAKGVNNVVSNIITGNFNVFGGNLIEMMKVPVLYGGDALKTINHVTNFIKRNDLVKAGVFQETDIPFKENPADPKIWNALRKANYKGLQTIQDLTFLFDAPMKTWAYEAGKAKGGHEEGMRAVQRITFANRLADPTFMQIDPVGRLGTQLTNYGMGTVRLYGNLWHEVASFKKDPERAKQAIAGLILYHTWLGLSAGTINALQGKDFNEAFQIGASQVPILYGIAEAISPELQEKSERNKGAGTQLTQASGVGRLFVGLDIAKKTVDTAGKSLKKAHEAVMNDDPETAVREATRALIKSTTFIPSVTGSKVGQGVSDWLLDWNEGDFEADQAGKQLLGRTTPFYKDEVEP